VFVILNEVKNFNQQAIRSFAGAQDDKLRSCRAECAVFAHSAKGNNAQVLLCRSEPAIGSRKRTSPGGLITLLRGHFVRPTRGMFVILNEVKNLDLHAIRSFAGAQDDKLRSCRAESASACPCSYAERVRHSAKANNNYV